jgi:hypothetical protein
LIQCPFVIYLRILDRKRNLVRFVPFADLTAASVSVRPGPGADIDAMVLFLPQCQLREVDGATAQYIAATQL